MTRERPILFSAPMVRAILEGRKTITRRVIKVPWVGRETCQPYEPHYIIEDGVLKNLDEYGHYIPVHCPYGQTGDRLWVRETWRVGAWNEDAGKIAVDYLADGYSRKEWLSVRDNKLFCRLWQQSTDEAIKIFGQRERYEWDPGASPCKWRPSIFMPHEFSRITLEITNVSVERLQDISEEDAQREGSFRFIKHDKGLHSCVDDFRALWKSINGSESWDANPWVWVIEFKRVEVQS